MVLLVMIPVPSELAIPPPAPAPPYPPAATLSAIRLPAMVITPALAIPPPYASNAGGAPDRLSVSRHCTSSTTPPALNTPPPKLSPNSSMRLPAAPPVSVTRRTVSVPVAATWSRRNGGACGSRAMTVVSASIPSMVRGLVIRGRPVGPSSVVWSTVVNVYVPAANWMISASGVLFAVWMAAMRQTDIPRHTVECRGGTHLYHRIEA